jgi:hypothetical protein
MLADADADAQLFRVKLPLMADKVSYVPGCGFALARLLS